MRMKVLIVANYNPGRFSPFVVEQVESLKKLGIDFDFFGIVGKGPLGYLKNLPALKRKIKEWKPDLIHAHYGLSGLLATLQTKVPVIVTYHGSDIHSGGLVQKLSTLAMKRAAHNIVVARHLKDMIGNVPRCAIIPCGVDDHIFYPISRTEARKTLGWSMDKRYVLFAGAFDREVKDPELAQGAVSSINDCELVELKGYNRQQVNILLNAADCLLMTSHNEGSPQIIKEAMCCGTPIVSVDVGDVADVCGDIEGCYICKPDVTKLKRAIFAAFAFAGKTSGPEIVRQKQLSIDNVGESVLSIYRRVLKVVEKDTEEPRSSNEVNC